MWKVIPGRPRAWYRPDCRQEQKIKHDKEFKEHKRSGKVISNGSMTITGIDDIYRLREKYKNILHK